MYTYRSCKGYVVMAVIIVYCGYIVIMFARTGSIEVHGTILAAVVITGAPVMIVITGLTTIFSMV